MVSAVGGASGYSFGASAATGVVGDWLVPLRPNASANARLLLFHYAGGGPTVVSPGHSSLQGLAAAH